MKYKVFLQQSVAACVPGLPGCWSQGATEEEALKLDNRLGEDWRDG